MQKTNFEKDFFKLMNNAVFGEKLENMKNIEVTIEWRRNHLVSEPNYHNTKVSTKHLLATVKRKA